MYSIKVSEIRDLPYNYKELYMKYEDENLSHKLIVKDNKPISIVSTRYEVIVNELLENELKKEFKNVGVRYSGNRIKCEIEEEDWGALVYNSMDGTIRLSSFLVEYKDKEKIVLPIVLLYSKHYKKVRGFDVVGFVNESLKIKDKVKDYMMKLRGKEITDDIKELMKGYIPNKYLVDSIDALDFYSRVMGNIINDEKNVLVEYSRMNYLIKVMRTNVIKEMLKV